MLNFVGDAKGVCMKTSFESEFVGQQVAEGKSSSISEGTGDNS